MTIRRKVILLLLFHQPPHAIVDMHEDAGALVQPGMIVRTQVVDAVGPDHVVDVFQRVP